MEYIFVYNKLREYSFYDDFVGVDSPLGKIAKTKGKLFLHRGEGKMILDNENYIYGSLMIASDISKLLRKLDHYMEHIEGDYENSKTMRGQVEVEVEGEIKKAWCYVYPLSKEYIFKREGVEIAIGDYLKYMKEIEENNV